MKVRTLTKTAMALVLMAGASAAHAATIQLVDDGTVAGTPAEQGFKIAAAYWSSVLTNNVTIRIQVGYDALGEGIIGETGSASQSVSVANWERGVARSESGFSLDSTSVMPTLTNGAIKTITSGPRSGQNGVNVDKKVYDTDGSTNNKMLDLNTANVKAIGGTAKYTGDFAAQKIDASITFSSNFGFDFNPTDGISDNTFDFIATAIHEMGHALGFVSGTDYYDVIDSYGALGNKLGGNLNKTDIFSALDMFRYSTDPTNLVAGSAPVLDESVGTASYFSIDGGKTQLFGDSLFSTGAYNGDGNQASHWKDAVGCSGQLGIMDPTECYAQPGEVTGLDLAAFDAIGWNLGFDVLKTGYLRTTSQIYDDFAGTSSSMVAGGSGFSFSNGRSIAAAVPETAAWLQMIAGAGLLGAALRVRPARRRHAA